MLRTAECREPHLTQKGPWDENSHSLEEHLEKMFCICNLCLALPLFYSLICNVEDSILVQLDLIELTSISYVVS